MGALVGNQKASAPAFASIQLFIGDGVFTASDITYRRQCLVLGD